jgi:hypothetical protein
MDIFVPETEDLEADRSKALEEAKERAKNISNCFVGDAAEFTGSLLHPFDREI